METCFTKNSTMLGLFVHCSLMKNLKMEIHLILVVTESLMEQSFFLLKATDKRRFMFLPIGKGTFVSYTC